MWKWILLVLCTGCTANAQFGVRSHIERHDTEVFATINLE